MARPSVKAERTEVILKAYERCIARYGVAGATLQKIAEEADMARPLLRHHVGNSDDLLEKALERYIERSDQSLRDFYQILPSNCDGATFVQYLFTEDPSEEASNDVMIAAAFIHAAQTNEMVQLRMENWFDDFQTQFTKQLQNLYPDANPDQVGQVSVGLIGIYFNLDAMAPLGRQAALREQSYQVALTLIKTLEK